MAVQPFERMVPMAKSPYSYFRPAWQVGQWSDFGEMNFDWQNQFKVMERQMKEMERHMEEMFLKFQQLVPSEPRMIHANSSDNRFSRDSWRNSEKLQLDNPFTRDKNGKPILKLTFDVRQFKPEEVNVKTLDQQLLVHAKHQEDSPNSKVYSEYNRQFLLPTSVNPESLKSVLSPEGVLTIEAPVNQALDRPNEIIIPIEHKQSTKAITAE